MMSEHDDLENQAKAACAQSFRAHLIGDIDLAAQHWLEFEVCTRKLATKRVLGKIANLKRTKK